MLDVFLQRKNTHIWKVKMRQNNEVFFFFSVKERLYGRLANLSGFQIHAVIRAGICSWPLGLCLAG